MKKLTLEKAQEILEFLQGKAAEGDITLAQENYLQAMELAVMVLSAKEAKPVACNFGKDNGDGTYSPTYDYWPLPSYIKPHKDWPVTLFYDGPQPAHTEQAIPDRTMLRNLVDLVWNEAKESTEVPSTKFADQLIDTVFPASTAKPEVL